MISWWKAAEVLGIGVMQGATATTANIILLIAKIPTPIPTIIMGTIVRKASSGAHVVNLDDMAFVATKSVTFF